MSEIRIIIGIWLVVAFAWKNALYARELGDGGWTRYLAEYVAAAIHTLPLVAGLYMALAGVL